MFYIDKYIPGNNQPHYFHKSTYNFLNLISNDESIPHLIFHGLDGIGKKTMMKTFLEYLYGDDVKRTKLIK
jgi:DNA polymerase III delta prime subunit